MSFKKKRNKQKTKREEIVERVKAWLTPKGIEVFTEYWQEYGTVSPVIFDGPVPHPVHFREGMAVRNQIRKMYPGDFTDHELDEMWKGIVKEAIQDQ